jgi:hypothetical protein
MTILTTQDQIHASESSKDLLETLKELTGDAPARFSSLAAGKARCIQALMAAGDRAAHAGVPKGAKVDPMRAPKVDPTVVGSEGGKKVVKADAEPKAEPKAKPAPAAKKVAAPFRAMVDAVTKPALDAEKAEKNLADYMAGKVSCPACGTESESDITAAGKEGTVAGDDRNFCHHCATEFWRATGKVFSRRNPGRDASVSAKESWLDADVKAARSKKDRVNANGTDYKSVAEAFKALKLNWSKHIKFRGDLKKAGKLAFDGVMFEIVSREVPVAKAAKKAKKA